ncbi:MAG: hypothetical protein H6970_12090 [Gammaproteobacteria bacterium]|nr:hypothetical protein [Gammaproteobacteria bacterium]MCP5458602.1 hypothetical protein [Gammaproteobacteria bacterium]
MQTGKRLFGVVVLALSLAGCFEEASFEFHEPGVYKGKTDPLLKKAGTPELESQLQARLTRIQTDR